MQIYEGKVLSKSVIPQNRAYNLLVEVDDEYKYYDFDVDADLMPSNIKKGDNVRVKVHDAPNNYIISVEVI